MNFKEELKVFIEQDISTRALLIDGKWGCGKTYFLKHFANTLIKDKKIKKQKSNANEGNQYVVGIVSLFGISSVEALHNAVYDVYTDVVFNGLYKIFKKTYKYIGKTIKSTIKLAGKIHGVNGISGIVDSVPFDPKKFIKVKKQISENKYFVLIFDDLERCKIDMIDLLGAINYYVETKEIKTIIVADEEHIKDIKPASKVKEECKVIEPNGDNLNRTKYNEFKEKLIERTLKFSATYDDILISMINSFSGEIEYFRFLNNISDKIKKVFYEEQGYNLRTIKTIINSFYRVFNTVNKLAQQSAINELPTLFYNFAILHYYSLKGYLDEINDDNLIEYNKFFSELQANYQFNCLANYIKSGYLNDEELVSQYTKLCEKKHDEEYLFWFGRLTNLNQDIIDKYFNKALSLAYEGKISFYHYNRILAIVSFVNEFEQKFLKSIEISKMEEALKKRLEKVKNCCLDDTSLDFFAFGYKPLSEFKNMVKLLKIIAEEANLYSSYNEVLKQISQISVVRGEFFLNRLLPTLDERFEKAILDLIPNVGNVEIERLSIAIEHMNLQHQDNCFDSNKTIEVLEDTKNEIEDIFNKSNDCVRKIYLNKLMLSLSNKIQSLRDNQDKQ